jgi:FtsH-binding integral membrane protein
MSVRELAMTARRARDTPVVRVTWGLAAMGLLAPSVALATPLSLGAPLEHRWLSTMLWHVGIGGLFLLAATYLLAGYADYLLVRDVLTDRYRDTHLLAYAVTHRTSALGGLTLLSAGALGVGFVTGVSLRAIVGYTLVWTVLFGLTVGLPLHPIDADLDELITTD